MHPPAPLSLGQGELRLKRGFMTKANPESMPWTCHYFSCSGHLGAVSGKKWPF